MKLATKQLTGAFVLAVVFSLFSAGAVSAGTEFSAAKVDAYANASIAVQGVIHEWSPKIKAAKTKQESQALKQKANALLVTAINQTEGITVEEYTQMLDASRADPNLRKKFDEAIKKKLSH
ncbi:MAG TPA: DUF4168 domain-containing protein [Sedimenticola sp.]|nr:DUF4168 domain-containing protein [Sedimenticola sp.]